MVWAMELKWVKYETFSHWIAHHFLLDFQAPSLEQDDGPREIKDRNTNKDNDENGDENENDESYPLLRETEFGATPVVKALKRQRRWGSLLISW